VLFNEKNKPSPYKKRRRLAVKFGIFILPAGD
jgi:hypothetical protein